MPTPLWTEGFPNLARSDEEHKDEKVVKAVSDQCRLELQAAGIPDHDLNFIPNHTEVPSTVVGGIKAWGFRRAWYYWCASGPGIPPDIATALHKRHGTKVRVNGNAGCPSPLEDNHGFAVGSYHVDNLEGLKALADTIKEIYRDHGVEV